MRNLFSKIYISVIPNTKHLVPITDLLAYLIIARIKVENEQYYSLPVILRYAMVQCVTLQHTETCMLLQKPYSWPHPWKISSHKYFFLDPSEAKGIHIILQPLSEMSSLVFLPQLSYYCSSQTSTDKKLLKYIQLEAEFVTTNRI